MGKQHRGWTIWFTGLSGSGKSTLACGLSKHLTNLSIAHHVLDGDEMRKELCRDLGFSKPDRCENVSRIGYVAELLNQHGIVSIVAAIAPYREPREEVRKRIGNFVEVYTECPLDTLTRRDVKGLYKRALSGEIRNFSGISDPYEPPETPEIHVNSGLQSEQETLAAIIFELEMRGYLRRVGSDSDLVGTAAGSYSTG